MSGPARRTWTRSSGATPAGGAPDAPGAHRSITRLLGRLTGIALFTLIGAVYIIGWLSILAEERTGRTDFVSLTVAARLTSSAPGLLYDLAAQYPLQVLADPFTGPARPFSNPPHVATYSRALLAFGQEHGYLALGVLNLVLLGAIGRMVLQISADQPRSRRLLLLAGSLAMFPVGNALAEGTVSIIVAFGLCLVLVGERNDDAVLLALGLALTCWKPHLAVIAWAAVAATGRWRVLGRAAALAALIAAPSLITPGPRAWLAYPRALLEAGGSTAAAVQHSDHWWNLAAVGYRTLPAELVAPLSTVLFVVGVAGLAMAHRRAPDRVPLTIVLLGGVLLAPHANPHDYIWVAVGHALLRADGAWEQRPRPARIALGAIAGAAPLGSGLTVAYAAAGGSVVAVAVIAAFAVATVVGAPVSRTAALVALPGTEARRSAA